MNRLHTNYKLTRDEYQYIVIMILLANISTGIGLIIGGVIILAL